MPGAILQLLLLYIFIIYHAVKHSLGLYSYCWAMSSSFWTPSFWIITSSDRHRMKDRRNDCTEEEVDDYRIVYLLIAKLVSKVDNVFFTGGSCYDRIESGLLSEHVLLRTRIFHVRINLFYHSHFVPLYGWPSPISPLPNCPNEIVNHTYLQKLF